MDFFEHQDAARRKTKIFVLYFVLAVAVIIGLVYVVVVGAYTYWLMESAHTNINHDTTEAFNQFWYPELFLWVAAYTLIAIFLGSLFKVINLRGGGAKVAQMLGGRIISPNTQDLYERRLLNVVEEMSIASGTPVPPVYLLDSQGGINAFAAGYWPTDAVVGVTSGCMKLLSRDELQGVIAHEFSHILNGDMRLNIRLIGVLHGILVIAIIGRSIFEMGALGRLSSRNHSYSRSHQSQMVSGVGYGRGRGGRGIDAALILGLSFIAVGSIGVFLGKLIKSAVSRQREYLADASAIQFTRNPGGLSGALKKIGGYYAGSDVRHPHAEEASHMFFSNGLTSSFLEALSTHPPIWERIARIDPTFTYEFPEVSDEPVALEDESAVSMLHAGGPPQDVASYHASPEQVSASVGSPTNQHLSYAQQLLASIPRDIRERAHEPYGARAVIYSLLLDKKQDMQNIQMTHLSSSADKNVLQELFYVLPAVQQLGPQYRLPVVDLCLPALRGLSESQYRDFLANVRQLIIADNQYSLFEYTLQHILIRHLEPSFTPTSPPEEKYSHLSQVLEPVRLLLSTLSYVGHRNTAASGKAFAEGRNAVFEGATWESFSAEECTLTNLDKALDMLRLTAPSLKRQIIKGASACVISDGEVTVEEAELLRAIADSLDAPIPPFLPGQTM